MLILMMLVTSCKTDVRTVGDLRDYANDQSNGLISILKKGDVILTLSYKPTDLVIEATSQYDTLMYFVLKLSDKGKSIESRLVRNEREFSQATSYLSGGILNDIYISDGDRRIYPLDVFYGGNWDVTGNTEVMFVFSKTALSNSDDLHVLFDDHLTSGGIYEFEFHSSDINRIPKLNPH